MTRPLRNHIADHFSKEELRSLCFDLGIDYENFPELKDGLIRELIRYCHRHRRLDDMLDALAARRPQVDWPLPMSLAEALDETIEPVSIYEPATVIVPAGPFLMGSPPDSSVPAAECPQHTVNLPAFRIGLYPVTNDQFQEFVRQTGHIVAPEMGWNGQAAPADRLSHPATGVTFFEALTYCRWLSAYSGRNYSLPTEAEWEKAARSNDGRRYPWGDDWQPDRCHHGSGETHPVDGYESQSIYGCFDMVGNAREWTRSIWGQARREPDDRYRYPWRDDARNDPEAGQHLRRVYRGGSAAEAPDRLRCAARNGYAPDRCGPPGHRHGFRVALYI
ncbi:MAG: SUMF1/EgtB/PvdO family nonheme iron enzyme [Candidatus Promineifilaceae bacterium]|nr:SUMF1/EgtB/PvdO family nonheme iron enzyme [Candidatus Promineifilaceae bacterium]